MAEGASNRAIAERMFLSERAVERSITAIFDRLGLCVLRQAPDRAAPRGPRATCARPDRALRTGPRLT